MLPVRRIVDKVVEIGPNPLSEAVILSNGEIFISTEGGNMSVVIPKGVTSFLDVRDLKGAFVLDSERMSKDGHEHVYFQSPSSSSI